MIETKFKKTELGLIPHDWEIKTIGELSSILTGATPSTDNPSYWGGEIRWMNSGELNNKVVYEVAGRITQDGYESASTHMLPKNCVLIGLAGQGKTRGTAAINKVELCTNQSIAAIIPSEKFNSEFLYHYIDNEYLKLRTLSSGDGGRGGLTKSLLNSYQVGVPSNLIEQCQIAEALTDVDSLISELTELIVKKRSVLKGTMQDFLSARRRLPGFNGEWSELKLKELFRMNSGGTPSTSDESYYIGSIPFLSISDISASSKYLYATQKHISDDGLNNSSARIFPKGTLLLSMYASIGKCIISTIDIAISQAILGFVPLTYWCDIDFIYYSLLLRKEDLIASGQTGTQSNLNKKIVENFPISVPKEKNEQHAIAQILSDMDAEIVELEAKREKYKAVRQGMMQQLLTGKIRLI